MKSYSLAYLKLSVLAQGKEVEKLNKQQKNEILKRNTKNTSKIFCRNDLGFIKD